MVHYTQASVSNYGGYINVQTVNTLEITSMYEYYHCSPKKGREIKAEIIDVDLVNTPDDKVVKHLL